MTPQVAPIQRQQKVRTSKGSAGMGQMIGTVLGGVVGAPGGLAGVSAGASLGGTIGGMIGGQVNPARQQVVDARPAAQPLQAPQLSQNGQQLQQSLMALKQFPMEFQQEVSFPLVAALLKDVKMNNPGMGGGMQQPQPQGLGSMIG